MPIELKGVSYTYMKGTPFEREALRDVSLTIVDGSLTAIAGHTGSGKSTRVQHLNGLLNPTKGKVLVDGVNLVGKDKETLLARRKVGMVFQYPEQQLFEETVAADIAFGPKNLELSEDEINRRVRSAMEFVQLDYETYKDVSPFRLSGGQMRRVAIAGVLALEPKYLVLDEPTAGLDPQAREELLRRIAELHRKKKLTIIFVSHNMEDIARMAERVVFMHDGRVLVDAPPSEAFFANEKIEEAGLSVPPTVALLSCLQENGLPVEADAFTVEETVKRISRAVRKKGGTTC
ncbi:MAG: energy-coupling factor transporter ATPase [Synergistaceae bacterium]|nr:energy-coupling factor transporter ATPase [Synergistaceae bacterium]